MSSRLLFLLSPAKSLDLSPVLNRSALVSKVPSFAKEADALVQEYLCKKSQKGLASLLGVSTSLATLNHARYQGWSSAVEKRAIFCYDGAAYKGLNAPSLSDKAITYLDQRLRIISGLYGMVRPLDMIKPYRLDMGTKVEATVGKKTFTTLYDYWYVFCPFAQIWPVYLQFQESSYLSHLTLCSLRRGESLSALLAQEGKGKAVVIINVASDEYSKAVLRTLPEENEGGPRVITCRFEHGGRVMSVCQCVAEERDRDSSFNALP